MPAIFEALRQAAEAHPDRPAIVCGSTRLSYREVGERVDRLSGALAGLGAKTGDRIAILSPNCHRFFELYFGVTQMGGVLVPLNHRLQGRELSDIVERSGATLLFVDPAHAAMLEAMHPLPQEVRRVVWMSEAGREGEPAYESLLAGARPDFTPVRTATADLAGILFTSGTTGEPKGVMLSHGNMLAHALGAESLFREECGAYLHVAAMFHVAATPGMLRHIQLGSKHVFIPRFDPAVVLEAIGREGITSVMLVPTMINLLLEHPQLDHSDLRSLREIGYAASPIAPDLLRRAIERLRCRFGQLYGLTEAAPLTVLRPEDHLAADGTVSPRSASCGRPAPGAVLRLVDDAGHDVPAGAIGEIVAQAPVVMLGYWRRPDLTAAIMPDGWLRSGDLASVDADGFYYLVDRRKDMIVTGGENVYSSEVEAVLYRHPAVKEAAVVGIPDDKWGEAVHACVVLRPGTAAAPDELIAYCRERLAGYKAPRSVEILPHDLPKGGSGKILKKELRERYWRGRERRVG